MSAFEEHREELEHYEQMFGRDRGRLAVSLDRLTNALCSRPARRLLHQPAQSRGSGDDLRIINQELVHAKELVAVCDGKNCAWLGQGKVEIGKAKLELEIKSQSLRTSTPTLPVFRNSIPAAKWIQLALVPDRGDGAMAWVGRWFRPASASACCAANS